MGALAVTQELGAPISSALVLSVGIRMTKHLSGGLDVFMLLAFRSVLVLTEPFVQEPGRKGTDLGLPQS